MSEIKQLVVMVCILGGLNLAQAADPVFICPSVVSGGSPPVVNSSVYSYRVTISIKSKNETVEAFEMYDMNRGVIQLVVNFPNETNASDWKKEWIQYDYSHNQTLTVDMGTKSCTVADLMKNETISIFGLGVEDGFKNVKYPFKWNENYNYTKKNDTSVNGVPANLYSTCIVFNQGKVKYDVDFYFSSKEWNTNSGREIPLKLVLKFKNAVGMLVKAYCSNAAYHVMKSEANSTKDGKSFDYDEYTYMFTSYQPDSTSGWKPEANNPLFNIRCDGRKDAMSLPQVWSKYAELEEIYDPVKKIVLSVKKYYDYGEKLSRADFVAPKHSPYGPKFPNHQFALIQDFHGGVQYMMDKETGNCTITNLTQSMVLFDVVDHHGLLSMIDHAKTMEERNYTYTGRHHLRRMTVDSWTSTVPAYWNGTRKGVFTEFWTDTTLIYSTQDWSNADVSPVLLNRLYHMTVKSNGTTTMYDYMGHVSGHSNLFHRSHLFGVTQCFKHDNVYKFVLKFSGSYAKYIGVYTKSMTNAIRRAVADAAGIRYIRVSSLTAMEMAPDDASDNLDKSLFVTTSIFDKPMFHANTEEYKPGINISDAISNLKKAVASNSLQVEFDVVGGDKVVMTAFSDYFKESGSLYSPKNPNPPTVSEGLSKGAMAAIGIGMILLGFILGAIFVHIRYKRGNRQFGYSMQD